LFCAGTDSEFFIWGAQVGKRRNFQHELVSLIKERQEIGKITYLFQFHSFSLITEVSQLKELTS
jgi:hypothetical protein